MGRFINADGLVSTGQGLLGNNMFAYCRNNPIIRHDPSGCWDWNCVDQALFGTTVLVVGLSLLLAVPTGGASVAVCGLTLSYTTAIAAGSSLAIGGTIIVGNAMAQATVNYAKTSKKSGKERATEKPSWVSRNDIDLGKSSQQNATDLLNNKYGSGNWGKGPKTEFNQIVKWIDRGVKIFISHMINILVEDEKWSSMK